VFAVVQPGRFALELALVVGAPQRKRRFGARVIDLEIAGLYDADVARGRVPIDRALFKRRRPEPTRATRANTKANVDACDQSLE